MISYQFCVALVPWSFLCMFVDMQFQFAMQLRSYTVGRLQK